MIGERHVLAIVPARRGSKGLPLKNIRPLGGKPLLAWPIEAALGSSFVDRVILSTDDPEFASVGVRYGADVPFLRPAELASDTSPSIDYILHALDALEAAGERYHYVVLLEPTSPLTDSADVDEALNQLDASSETADALVGVSRMVTTHPAYAVKIGADGLISPHAAPDFRHLPRRQDLTPLFCLDGSIYISTIDALRRESGFCHGRTIAYETARHKAFEVDDLVDFVCIEAILDRLELIRRDATASPEAN